MQLSERAQRLQPSGIREVAELGMRMDDVIPLWFGEGAWPTPEPIVDAAVDALRHGEHQYQPNNGSLALRQAITHYLNRQLGCALDVPRITVTPSGMQGLMLSAQILVSPGDRVVVIEPGWPNIAECFAAMGASIHGLSLQADEGRWQLDMDKLMDALRPGTCACVINSPNNPTGWSLSDEQQNLILSHCREHGIWLVCDDVYARLYRHGSHAPSFLSKSDEHDRILSVHSFSKSWSMTGWRLGWIVAPPELEARLGQLTEFNTSCTPGFVQAAGCVALAQGEPDVQRLGGRLQQGYALTAAALSELSRVRFIEPDGAFYCFFEVDGLTDSLQASKQLLTQAKVGLAPGSAFGPAGEGFLRLCYAQPEAVLADAFERLRPFLS